VLYRRARDDASPDIARQRHGASRLLATQAWLRILERECPVCSRPPSPRSPRKFLHRLVLTHPTAWLTHSHLPPPPSHSTPVGDDSPLGCDQTPSTPVAAARASSAPSAHPCPAELTLAKIEEFPSSPSPAVGMAVSSPSRPEGGGPGQRVREAPRASAKPPAEGPATPRSITASERSIEGEMVAVEHVLCCKNDSGLSRKVSLRRLS